ncbi:hypothetical protein [Mycobacterium montefiorense]|uniref:hypothetical protein n=1 Tax=Mycobacterium montefiorense TaxID=154654 RepID=UPI00222E4333|nr:hypothetical protein [Mycobacterium montefiorense]
MDEKIRYVVMCSCTGSLEPIAYIDDHRPSEHPQSILRGLITITGPSSQKLASGLPSTLAIPKDDANAKRKTANVSEIFWGDGHVEWTLRCLECEVEVRMHRDTIRRVADELAAGLDQCPLVKLPDPKEPERHLIQLGVLNDRVSRQDR